MNIFLKSNPSHSLEPPSPIHAATVDADGVALAAIQGLNQKLTDELKRRDAENAELKRRLAHLEKLVTNLNAKGN